MYCYDLNDTLGLSLYGYAGIVVPCILPGYWRDQPPTEEEMGNFHKYSVYSCDYADSCKGGCQLNASCSGDREQTSPTCGVCKEGYYLCSGDCLQCGSMQQGAIWVLGILYGVCGGMFVLAIFFVLWGSVTFSMSSFRVKASMASVDAKSDGRPVTLGHRFSLGMGKLTSILKNRRNVKVGKKFIRGIVNVRNFNDVVTSVLVVFVLRDCHDG